MATLGAMVFDASARLAGWLRAAGFTAALLVLAGCASSPSGPALRPEDARARIAALIPATVPDRPAWALDIYAAFTSLGIAPTVENTCQVLAVTEQESGYRADPTVPGLGRIAREEIDRRADRAGIPRLVVDGALGLRSPDSRTWNERISAAKTEKELSDIFEDFIATVPFGQRFLAGYNPVRTGGPMQVNVDFAEQQLKAKPYPYRMAGSVRQEVFTRRGGLYFGIAHLLDYPTAYDQPIYRFADFNAGQYASRNAALQQALSLASGTPLDLDGDLVLGDGTTSRTETAALALGPRLGLGEGEIRRALQQERSPGLAETRLYARTFGLAEQVSGRSVPRAVIPHIDLHSPKITRPLTTEWFARRVDERYRRCLARAG